MRPSPGRRLAASALLTLAALLAAMLVPLVAGWLL